MIRQNGVDLVSYSADTIEGALTKATTAYPDSQHPVMEIFGQIESEVNRPSAFIKENFFAIITRGRGLFSR